MGAPGLHPPDHPNFTDDLLTWWLALGRSPCWEARTATISVPTLDGAAVKGEAVELSAGDIHEFMFWALDDAGGRRCLGGDYFEVDLSGAAWKSRPPVVDRGDGSYSVCLQVTPCFAMGEFCLTIVLLFRSFKGLKFSSAKFKYRTKLRDIPLLFQPGSNASLPALEVCCVANFARNASSGRWTRLTRKVVLQQCWHFLCRYQDCEDLGNNLRISCWRSLVQSLEMRAPNPS